MKYAVRVSRPLSDAVSEAMATIVGDEEQLPEILGKILEESSSMDALISEIMGSTPESSGAGFGSRDLVWYDLEWNRAVEAAKMLLDRLVGAHIIISMASMEDAERRNKSV